MQAAAPTARLGEQLPGLPGATGMQLALGMGLESLARLQTPVHMEWQPCKSPWCGMPVNPIPVVQHPCKSLSPLRSIPANPWGCQEPREHRWCLSDSAGKPGSPARLQIPAPTAMAALHAIHPCVAWHLCKSPHHGDLQAKPPAPQGSQTRREHSKMREKTGLL